jgi:hypothetical protein
VTSAEDEFLEPEPHPEQEPPARRRAGVADWVAALVWTAAAALAVIAPFQRLYGSGASLPRRYADYLPSSVGSVNGWGNGDALGPRFGIALVACAAGCAVLALAAWVRLLGRRAQMGPHRVLAGVSVAAPSLLAGVVGTIALFLAFDSNPALGWTSYRAPGLQFEPPQAYSSHLSIAFATTTNHAHSWCLWLAVAALVCAVAAAVAQSAANRTDRHLAG